MSDYQHLQVTTATDSPEVAEELARSAVAERLVAAAAVVGPVTSTYRRRGVVRSSQEWQAVFKIPLDAYDTLQAHIRARHNYELPGIWCVPIVAGYPPYLDWLSEEAGPA